jgi:hypothetical protein
MLINETLYHKVEVICFFNKSLNFLASIRGPMDLGSKISKCLLFILYLNDFVLNLAKLLIKCGRFFNVLVCQLHKLVLHQAQLGLDLSDLIKRLIRHLFEDNVNIVHFADVNFFESQEINPEHVHITLQLLDSLLKVFKVKLLIKGFEGLRDEVILETLNSNHKVFLELVLPLHEGFLPPVHTLNNINLLSHSLFKFLHSFGVDCVTIFKILCSSQMGFTVFLNIFYSSDLLRVK